MSSVPRPISALARMIATSLVVGLAVGCESRSTVDQEPPGATASPMSAEDQAVFQKLKSQVDAIVSAKVERYGELRYEYTEGLLDTLDQIERTLAGEIKGEPPRFLTKLDPEDEREHLRETVRRWEARTGKNLRAEIDVLKADVASRKEGERHHPEFQRKFSKSFDDFILVEVTEIHERRNRAIHAAAEELLAPLREKHPEPVRRIEALLNTPPYHLPKSEDATPTGKTP
ncbi:MAG: hypothetical protein AB7I30_19965 [Isosphaeraceae bacterium]